MFIELYPLKVKCLPYLIMLPSWYLFLSYDGNYQLVEGKEDDGTVEMLLTGLLLLLLW